VTNDLVREGLARDIFQALQRMIQAFLETPSFEANSGKSLQTGKSGKELTLQIVMHRMEL